MTELIKELTLANDSIFNSVDKYVIPLYQRAYSWTDNEIEQLIDDIEGFDEKEYYIGPLIVNKRNENSYEVIDGQQRLTTLYLLFKVLGLNTYKSLSFECRDKSNYSLEHLSDGEKDEMMIEKSIFDGRRIIDEKLKTIDEEKFKEKLSKVIIYRIEVPPHTDLNRYFEIMNTRGEQLEQHDILKATLMGYLRTNNERKSFALIWDACRDMTGYLQMHFVKEKREILFGGEWACPVSNPFETLVNDETGVEKEGKTKSIEEIIKSDPKEIELSETEEYKERIRFESIIEFPYFLEHVLKVFVANKNITCENSDDKLIPEQLDDKKLLDIFKKVIDYGFIDSKHIDKYDFSCDFINCLIKCRFLFDKYIVKRECPLNDQEGVWSIKEIKVYGQGSNKKADFNKTPFHRYREQWKTYNPRNQQNVMIQSCLRVSYTSPKVMHWITKLLLVLYKAPDEYALVNFACDAENIARETIDNNFFKPCNDVYKMGVNTPHIVFNYLDYLLWKEEQKEYDKFTFEFRNSVEHWYPQHPSDGTFPKWENVDTFGNLCIIQRNVNSKFSNMALEAKNSTYKEMISKGSLKLRIMSKLTTKSIQWKDFDCAKHEQEIIKILKKDIKKMILPNKQ